MHVLWKILQTCNWTAFPYLKKIRLKISNINKRMNSPASAYKALRLKFSAVIEENLTATVIIWMAVSNLNGIETPLYDQQSLVLHFFFVFYSHFAVSCVENFFSSVETRLSLKPVRLVCLKLNRETWKLFKCENLNRAKKKFLFANVKCVRELSVSTILQFRGASHSCYFDCVIRSVAAVSAYQNRKWKSKAISRRIESWNWKLIENLIKTLFESKFFVEDS